MRNGEIGAAMPIARLCAIFDSSPIWFAAELARHLLIDAKPLFVRSE